MIHGTMKARKDMMSACRVIRMVVTSIRLKAVNHRSGRPPATVGTIACAGFPATATEDLDVRTTPGAIADVAKVVGECLRNGRFWHVPLVKRPPIVWDALVKRVRDAISVGIDPTTHSGVTTPELDESVICHVTSHRVLHPQVWIANEIVAENCASFGVDDFLISYPTVC